MTQDSGSLAPKICLPIQTPEPPAEIANSTIWSSSINEIFLGPPEMRTGIGTACHTNLKDSTSPVQGTLTTSHPSSHATLAALATPFVISPSLTP